jgi:hypothetical protein
MGGRASSNSRQSSASGRRSASAMGDNDKVTKIARSPRSGRLMISSMPFSRIGRAASNSSTSSSWLSDALCRLATGGSFAVRRLYTDATIKRAELADNETSLTVANDLTVRRALESAGVIFIDADDTAGPGVRLRKL